MCGCRTYAEGILAVTLYTQPADYLAGGHKPHVFRGGCIAFRDFFISSFVSSCYVLLNTVDILNLLSGYVSSQFRRAQPRKRICGHSCCMHTYMQASLIWNSNPSVWVTCPSSEISFAARTNYRLETGVHPEIATTCVAYRASHPGKFTTTTTTTSNGLVIQNRTKQDTACPRT